MSTSSERENVPPAKPSPDDGQQTTPEPITEAERVHGAGKLGRLAGPRPPAPEERIETPVMGIVPAEPNSSDDAGEIDHMRGDPTRVRESARGSADDDESGEEARRRARYAEGATEVSEM
jgi:hypothetical protein